MSVWKGSFYLAVPSSPRSLDSSAGSSAGEKRPKTNHLGGLYGPGLKTAHISFSLYTTDQNPVTWPLKASRDAGKCSLALVPRKASESIPVSTSCINYFLPQYGNSFISHNNLLG